VLLLGGVSAVLLLGSGVGIIAAGAGVFTGVGGGTATASV
jgi:hypothetical protein